MYYYYNSTFTIHPLQGKPLWAIDLFIILNNNAKPTLSSTVMVVIFSSAAPGFVVTELPAAAAYALYIAMMVQQITLLKCLFFYSRFVSSVCVCVCVCVRARNSVCVCVCVCAPCMRACGRACIYACILSTCFQMNFYTGV